MPVTALFLHRNLDFYGGVPQTFLTFAQYRDRSRCRMLAAGFQALSDEMVSQLDTENVPAHHIGESYSDAIRSLRRLIASEKIDVIVCGSFKSMVTARFASRGLDCKVIFWVPAVPLIAGRMRQLSFRLLAREMHLVFTSYAVATQHSHSWHRGKKTVLYNGIPDVRPEDVTGGHSLRSSLGIAHDAFLLGFVAEFTPWKNHLTLLEAFGLLSEAHPAIHLVLVGTGRIFEHIRTMAAGMDASDRIHFLGARPDVRSLLPEMDIYVHPADGEGFGLAVAEAMLAGLPVVAANAGALPEVVEDGITGFLFDAHDPTDLAENITLLIDQPKLRLDFGAAGRLRCLDTFSPESFAQSLTSIIEHEAGPPS